MAEIGSIWSSLFGFGSPHWKHSEPSFEKKALIPVLQQLLVRTKGA